MVHLVHLLLTSRISSIRGQYDEIYVNGGVVYPWFMTLQLWFMTVFYSSRGLDRSVMRYSNGQYKRYSNGQYKRYCNGFMTVLLFSWP